MGETGLYVGNKTMMAATARAENVRRTMGVGPMAWLTVVAQVIGLGRVPEGYREGDPRNRAFSRGVLRGLGYDPDTHTLGKRAGHWPGLVVRDHVGDPQAFISERKLRELGSDPNFLEGFAVEVDA
jgi:hypothetical protein